MPPGLSFARMGFICPDGVWQDAGALYTTLQDALDLNAHASRVTHLETNPGNAVHYSTSRR